MEHLRLLQKETLKALVNKRSGETKFGEHVKLLSNVSNIYDDLVDLDVTYVIFGICEDIGVLANKGNQGAAHAWETTLKSLVNTQSNAFTVPEKVLVLGHLDFSKSLQKIAPLEASPKKAIKKARQKTEYIDKQVSYLIQQIVKAGKTPIVIGGGHNNAYGNIKGTSLALNTPINSINFDAHTDFRREEGRHSGNGFSYAFTEGFLKNYYIFGLHENYTSQHLFKTIKKLKNIKYTTFEALQIRKETTFKNELEKAQQHIGSNPFGLEIDCDAIQSIPSSAMTPSGFSVTKTRRFVYYFAQQPDVKYLHLCEAAPTTNTFTQVGKLLSYLITDFIKGHNATHCAD